MGVPCRGESFSGGGRGHSAPELFDAGLSHTRAVHTERGGPQSREPENLFQFVGKLSIRNLRGVHSLDDSSFFGRAFGSSGKGLPASGIFHEIGRSYPAYNSSRLDYGVASGAYVMAGRHPGLALGGPALLLEHSRCGLNRLLAWRHASFHVEIPSSSSAVRRSLLRLPGSPVS